MSASAEGNPFWRKTRENLRFSRWIPSSFSRHCSGTSGEEGPGPGGEGTARFGPRIKHVAATINLQRHALAGKRRRQVVDNIAAHPIGRHEIAIAMGDQQAEFRIG